MNQVLGSSSILFVISRTTFFINIVTLIFFVIYGLTYIFSVTWYSDVSIYIKSKICRLSFNSQQYFTTSHQPSPPWQCLYWSQNTRISRRLYYGPLISASSHYRPPSTAGDQPYHYLGGRQFEADDTTDFCHAPPGWWSCTVPCRTMTPH
jgi:hypothetical protein